jgi:hypothetical protein
MADNFQITPGSGLTVSAEDIGGSGVYAERVKLLESTAGSSTGLSKRRNTLSGATHDGLLMLGVRNETLTSFADAEGKYAPIATDEEGRLIIAPGVELATAGGLALDSTLISISGDIGDQTDVEAAGNGSLIAIAKRLRTLLGAGLPAALVGGRLDINIGSSGVPIGGGTQYTEGDTDATVTGTALMWEDTADTLRSVSAAKPLPVNIVAGSGGGPSKVDDAAFTVAVDSVAPIGAMADETTPDSVDEGDVGIVRMSTNRNLYTQIRDVTAERSVSVTAANALKVDGSAVTQPVSGTVTANLAAGTNNIGDVDVLTLPSLPAGVNNIGDVDIASFTAGAIVEVQGDVAQDAGVAGNPVLVGLRASDAEPSAMSADGDAVFAWGDRSGRTVITEKSATATLSSVNDTATSTTLLAANAARLGVIIHNDSTSILYAKFGATASATSYTYRVEPNATLELAYGYTGLIDGIWSADAAGAARITEIT